MCVVSAVLDYGMQRPYPWTPEQIQDYERLIEEAKRFDESAGEPDCENDEKWKWYQELKEELTEYTTISFYGSSDDLIEIEGDIKGCDEYPAQPANNDFVVAGLTVSVGYGVNGCWVIIVQQLDEDVEVEAKNMRLSVAPNGYSMLLEMDVPKGSYIVRSN
jgi:hypothetical protein